MLDSAAPCGRPCTELAHNWCPPHALPPSPCPTSLPMPFLPPHALPPSLCPPSLPMPSLPPHALPPSPCPPSLPMPYLPPHALPPSPCPTSLPRFQMYSSLLLGASSHKDTASRSALVRFYYTNRIFMGYCCTSCEVRGGGRRLESGRWMGAGLYHPRVCHVPPTCCTSLCRAGPVPLSVRPVLRRRPQLHAAALSPHHAAGCRGVGTAARLRGDVQRVGDSAAHILCPCCGGSTGSAAPCRDQSGIPVTLIRLFVICVGQDHPSPAFGTCVQSLFPFPCPAGAAVRPSEVLRSDVYFPTATCACLPDLPRHHPLALPCPLLWIPGALSSASPFTPST